MKTIGLVGGLGPESTVDYYRGIVELHRSVTGGHSPALLITSLDVRALLALVEARDLDTLTDILVAEIERLSRAGADFAAIAANTPHIVFDRILARSPIPLVSIVEATRDRALARGDAKLGLLGTRFTLNAGFYGEVFARANMSLVLPTPEEIDDLHDLYLTELLDGNFTSEARGWIRAVIERLARDAGVDAVTPHTSACRFSIRRRFTSRASLQPRSSETVVRQCRTARAVPTLARTASYMRILITGGAGFIGSHIADAYAAGGHDLLVVDNLWDHGGGRRENVTPSTTFVEMDIRDAGLSRVFDDFKPEIVSHHAAQHSVAISSRDPGFDAQVNVIGLLNVLDNAARTGVQKVIFASSGATFGEPEKLPIDETTPQRPESPYAITKMVAEHYLRFYRAQHGLDFTALRYGNVYGPRQDPNGEAGVVSIFIGKFLARAGVKIYWDGEQTRDYIYVGDVARSNVQALTHGSGSCYVIGTGKKTSVNEIYRALVEVTGFEAPIERLERRPGDVRDAQFDSAVAQRELEWSVRTPLVEGMRRTVEYFRELGTV